jgi:ATP-dependent DNA ligase
MIAEASAQRPAILVVFDLLEVDGDDLRSLPLIERRHALHAHIDQVPGIQIIEHVEVHGEALFRAIAADDHEGIVAKRADAPYRAGPHNAWLKVKNRAYSRRAAVEWRG